MKKFATFFLAAYAIGFPVAIATAGPVSERRPNIVFCLADDWSWPNAGAYGDKIARTPAFDRVAKEGVLFRSAFCAAPSCTASRASILTGQAPHRLEQGADLWSFLPAKFPVTPDLLEKAGYAVGFSGKGWGPGKFEAGGRTRNPAGPKFKNFNEFLGKAPKDRPFCFWFGSVDPHRPYELGAGKRAGYRTKDVTVPPYLPDTEEVRSDILDYYTEVERFDHDVAHILDALERAGSLDDTLVVISGDNGWPFPRAKANLYEAGIRQPLAMRWPARIKAGRAVDALVVLTDLAPTFLEAAGLKPPSEMTGRSLLGLAVGDEPNENDARREVFIERERHANVRRGDLSYPSRALRTDRYLYIRNFRPDLHPAGDPELYFAVGPYGDCDGSPTKSLLLSRKDDKDVAGMFKLAFAKRPAEELYDLRDDPHAMVDVAENQRFAPIKRDLAARLIRWMTDTRDPRAQGETDLWDRAPYFGDPEPRAPAKRERR